MGLGWVKIAPGLLALTLLASACGSDDKDDAKTDDKSSDTTEESSSAGDDAAGEDEYVQALVTSLAAGDDGFGDQATNECVAGVYIDVIGLEQLQAAVTPDEIVAQPDAEPSDFGLELDPQDVWTGLNTCVDAVELMSSEMVGGDEAITACLKSTTTEAQWMELFVSSYDGGEPSPEALAEVTAAAAQCGAAG